MQDAAGSSASTVRLSANKEPQFSQIEAAVLASIRKLVSSTTEADLATTTTQLSGALTLALCHINKISLHLSAAKTSPVDTEKPGVTSSPGVHSRIMILSVSDSEPSQYIPTMNAVFAAAHAQIAIDTLSLAGDATFLQQASFITNGTFLAASEPQGLLQYLMMGFMNDGDARAALIAPTHHTVDFRAACFCHGRVVDTGFVCSICLSIFCEVPDGAECLTCGTKLALGSYGAKPAVMLRKKKKKKKVGNGGREETGSAGGTPRP
jgi:transcription initiation factor TFIIH subunit 3